jgi:hypothetical protein
MAILNFQKQFAVIVALGVKRQTIRPGGSTRSERGRILLSIPGSARSRRSS